MIDLEYLETTSEMRVAQGQGIETGPQQDGLTDAAVHCQSQMILGKPGPRDDVETHASAPVGIAFLRRHLGWRQVQDRTGERIFENGPFFKDLMGGPMKCCAIGGTATDGGSFDASAALLGPGADIVLCHRLATEKDGLPGCPGRPSPVFVRTAETTARPAEVSRAARRSGS